MNYQISCQKAKKGTVSQFGILIFGEWNYGSKMPLVSHKGHTSSQNNFFFDDRQNNLFALDVKEIN